MPEAHSTAVTSFDANHVSYDQFRPSFYDPIVDAFLSDLGLYDSKSGKYNNSKNILEIASGTGKFTKTLVSRGWDGSNDNLVALEPSAGMIETFQKNLPNIKATQGSSYKIPFEDSSFDAIVVAQGFHWFSDVDSLKELNRVLKKDGVFGCIWNFDCPSKDAQALISNLGEDKITYIFDGTSTEREKFESKVQVVPSSLSKPYDISLDFFKQSPWSLSVGSYVYTFDIKVPQYRRGDWRKLFSTDESLKLFSPILKETFYFTIQDIEWDSVYKLWETRSYITEKSDAEKLEIKEHIEKLLTQDVREGDKTTKDGKIILKKALGSHSIVLKAQK